MIWVPLRPKRFITERPTMPPAPKTVATLPEKDERYPGPFFILAREAEPSTSAILGRLSGGPRAGADVERGAEALTKAPAAAFLAAAPITADLAVNAAILLELARTITVNL